MPPAGFNPSLFIVVIAALVGVGCAGEDNSLVPETIWMGLRWESSTAPDNDDCYNLPPTGYLGSLHDDVPRFYDGTTGSGTSGEPFLVCDGGVRVSGNEFSVTGCRDVNGQAVHSFIIRLDLADGSAISNARYVSPGGLVTPCMAQHRLFNILERQ